MKKIVIQNQSEVSQRTHFNTMRFKNYKNLLARLLRESERAYF